MGINMLGKYNKLRNVDVLHREIHVLVNTLLDKVSAL